MPGMDDGMPTQYAVTASSPALEHEDYKTGLAEKEAATALFKAGDFEGAADKFQSAISAVRLSEDIKNEVPVQTLMT